MNRQEQFTQIYKQNKWQGTESVSGKGSDIVQTKILNQELIRMINTLEVKTFIDVCGDFNWMRYAVDKLNIEHYIGIDIVAEMIDKLNHQYATSKINFINTDIITDQLPSGDLLLCRDCLVHLTFESIYSFLHNFIKSDINYLLTTTFDTTRINFNLRGDGQGWFPICLMNSPFHFPEPKLTINEQCTEEGNKWTDKSLGLWTKQQIKGALCGK